MATGLNRSTIYVADPGAGCGKGEKRVQRVECSFDGIDPGGVARACQCAGAALGGESGAYLALRYGRKRRRGHRRLYLRLCPAFERVDDALRPLQGQTVVLVALIA